MKKDSTIYDLHCLCYLERNYWCYFSVTYFENILTNYKAFTIRDRKTKQSGNQIKWEREEA